MPVTLVDPYERDPATCDHDRETCRECVARCRVCGEDHGSPEALTAHVAAAHPVDEYGCPHCGRPMGH